MESFNPCEAIFPYRGEFFSASGQRLAYTGVEGILATARSSDLRTFLTPSSPLVNGRRQR